MGSRVPLLFALAAVVVLAFSVQAGSAGTAGWLSRTVCTANQTPKVQLRCGKRHVWHESGVIRWVRHHALGRTQTEAVEPQVAHRYKEMLRNHLWLRRRALGWVREAQQRLSAARLASVSQGSVQHIICAVFGPALCQTALYIAKRESGYDITASNGTHWGLFQLDASALHSYAKIGYSTAYQQVVAAHVMFLARGWEPWTCCEG